MGALGVILGAFGAHGLESILPEKSIETYETGIFYHLFHSVVLLSIALNSKYDLRNAFNFMLMGIILFSFSLYTYSVFDIKFLVFIIKKACLLKFGHGRPPPERCVATFQNPISLKLFLSCQYNRKDSVYFYEGFDAVSKSLHV